MLSLIIEEVFSAYSFFANWNEIQQRGENVFEYLVSWMQLIPQVPIKNGVLARLLQE
jgi:hypothetical protein